MAYFVTGGPCYVYVALPGATTASFLGTCEQAPEVEITEYRTPVFNDIGGREAPTQFVSAGQTAVLKTLLTRFNYNVYNAIASTPATAWGTGGPGIQTRFGVGSLVLGVSSLQVCLVNAFLVNNSAQTAMGIPTGVIPSVTRFVAASLAAHTPSPSGTAAMKLGLVFDCQRIWNPATGAFTLYDRNDNNPTLTIPDPD